VVCLIVDDEAPIRTLVGSMVRPEGFEVLEASGGIAALEKLRELDGAVDLIIADIQMPEGDGVTLANQVSRTFPAVHVILMSGYGEYPDNSDFVAKPFSKQTMLETVRRVLTRGAARPGCSEPYRER
jgi:two-component system cell cycle sensor histidine kinase/response regulator CckA